MTKIEIELPDATAKAAREAGLLTPAVFNQLLIDALQRRRASGRLLSIADRVAAAGLDPLPMEEIDAEVKAFRAGHKLRAGGR
jgi:hypothetical protein